MALMLRGPAPIKRLYLNKGLNCVCMGNGYFWSLGSGWSPGSSYVGPPKKLPSPYGSMFGYGGTSGTGINDRMSGPTIPASVTFRSLVSFFLAVNAGSSNAGRIFNGAGETGLDANNESMGWTISGGAGNNIRYTATGNSVSGQWYLPFSTLGVWGSVGISQNRPALANPDGYVNGEPATVATASAAAVAYTVRNFGLNIGNRSSDNARVWEGLLGPLYFFSHPTAALTAEDHRILGKNPLALFDFDQQDESQSFGAGITTYDVTLATAMVFEQAYSTLLEAGATMGVGTEYTIAKSVQAVMDSTVRFSMIFDLEKHVQAVVDMSIASGIQVNIAHSALAESYGTLQSGIIVPISYTGQMQADSTIQVQTTQDAAYSTLLESQGTLSVSTDHTVTPSTLVEIGATLRVNVVHSTEGSGADFYNNSIQTATVHDITFSSQVIAGSTLAVSTEFSTAFSSNVVMGVGIIVGITLDADYRTQGIVNATISEAVTFGGIFAGTTGEGPPTPDCRILTVNADNRTFNVPNDGRTIWVFC